MTPEDETPSPTPDSSSADASPALHHKHHHPAASPAPAEEDTSASPAENSAGEPSPSHHQHRFPAESPSPSPEDTALASPIPKPRPSFGPDASLDSDQIEDFSRQPAKVRSFIESSLGLARQNLTYTYSSADPANGGMDCSGFVYYILTQAGFPDVPRDASGQYSWLRKAGTFRAVISRNLNGFELDELKPGDLLFWSDTYETSHDPPVTHTMIYLGREKETGNRVMVGSSDGRSYHGVRRWGVSVFDFKSVAAATPSPGHTTPRFIGYGSIPGM